jgi:flagellar biosynthesis/type III secretory pathway M-ring protein FliF/YscJ
VLEKTITKKVRSLGVSVPPGGADFDNAPLEALLAGYRAAQWLNFAFVMVGLTLAVVFLRDIGMIARKHPEPENVRARDVERQEPEKMSEEAAAGLENPTRDDNERAMGVELGSEA